MKILTIESPHQLQDDRVKASIVVSEDDLIPLVQLMKDARKGKEIELDAKQSDTEPQDYYFNLASQITRDLAESLRVAYQKGIADTMNAFVDADERKPEVIYESPERQADVMKAHDLIDNGNDRY